MGEELFLGELKGGEDEYGSDESGHVSLSLSWSLLPLIGALVARGHFMREVTSHGLSLGWPPSSIVLLSSTRGHGLFVDSSPPLATTFSGKIGH